MKHSNAYSIEGDYREQVSKWIAVISVALFFAVNTYLTPCVMGLLSCIIEGSPFLEMLVGIIFGAISAFFFYSLLWWLFDCHLWKCKPFLRWHHIKNLNGTWKGKGISSFCDKDGKNVEYAFQLTINQTFTKMACEVETKNSRSSGILMGVQCSDDLATGCHLNMAYSNKTRSEDSTNIETWHPKHTGFCSYWIEDNEMTGDYFTDSTPQTKGRIFLRREIGVVHKAKGI